MFGESVLFCHSGSRIGTQVIRLSSQCLHLLSHLLAWVLFKMFIYGSWSDGSELRALAAPEVLSSSPSDHTYTEIILRKEKSHALGALTKRTHNSLKVDRKPVCLKQ